MRIFLPPAPALFVVPSKSRQRGLLLVVVVRVAKPGSITVARLKFLPRGRRIFPTAVVPLQAN